MIVGYQTMLSWLSRHSYRRCQHAHRISRLLPPAIKPTERSKFANAIIIKTGTKLVCHCMYSYVPM